MVPYIQVCSLFLSAQGFYNVPTSEPLGLESAGEHLASRYGNTFRSAGGPYCVFCVRFAFMQQKQKQHICRGIVSHMHACRNVSVSNSDLPCRIFWAIGLLASGQVATISLTYAGQLVMTGLLGVKVTRGDKGSDQVGMMQNTGRSQASHPVFALVGHSAPVFRCPHNPFRTCCLPLSPQPLHKLVGDQNGSVSHHKPTAM